MPTADRQPYSAQHADHVSKGLLEAKELFKGLTSLRNLDLSGTVIRPKQILQVAAGLRRMHHLQTLALDLQVHADVVESQVGPVVSRMLALLPAVHVWSC